MRCAGITWDLLAATTKTDRAGVKAIAARDAAKPAACVARVLSVALIRAGAGARVATGAGAGAVTTLVDVPTLAITAEAEAEAVTLGRQPRTACRTGSHRRVPCAVCLCVRRR